MKWRKHKQLLGSVYPVIYHQLIHDQNRIACRQIWNRRWSKQWQYLQGKHRLSHSIQKETGHEWTLHLWLSVWQSWDDLWAERNSIVHGDTPQARAHIFQEKVVRKLKQIYTTNNICTYYLATANTCYLVTIPTPNKVYSIANWIHVYDPMFKQSIHQASQSSITSYLDKPPQIHNYFTQTK